MLKRANSILKLGRNAVKGLMGEEEKCTIVNVMEELLTGKYAVELSMIEIGIPR